jgi:hypothetical protein
MKTKKELIDYINTNYKRSLNNSNTSYSKVNISKDVWWFNVPVHKFTQDVNLLLQIEDGVFWVVLPVGFVKSIEKTFRIRRDKDAVDLEINAGSRNFLCDVKSGGTGFNFGEFIKKEVFFNI